MRSRGRTGLALGAVLAVAVCVLTASAGTATGASARAASLVPKVGTGTPVTGPFTSWDGAPTDEEFAGEGSGEEGINPYNGTISFSGSAGSGGSVTSGKKAKSNPTFNFGFSGLNH